MSKKNSRKAAIKTRIKKRKNLFIFFNFAILLYCIGAAGSLCLAGENFVYEASDTRDPFVPLVSSDGRLLNWNKQTQQELQVNGIIYDKEGVSYAIVNSTVVKAGDTIGEYKVLRIEEDKIIFNKNGQPLEIEIDKEEEEAE